MLEQSIVCISSRLLPLLLRRASTAAFPKSAASASSEDLVITDRCAKRLRAIAESDEYLKIFVESGGCSGFEYKFSLTKDIEQDDRIIEKNGARIAIDTISLDLLRGATVDYKEELIRSSFRIEANPNAEKGCSCGSSFALKASKF